MPDAPSAWATLPGTGDLLRQSGLKADKRLGQHFLLDPAILDRIAAQLGNVDGLTILEVGPGPGGLTRALLGTGARRIVAVERDTRWVEALAPLAHASAGRLEVVAGDALHYRLAEANGGGPVAICANLPYNVGTAVLLGWLQQLELVSAMVLMFQREVAERIVALPGDDGYGRLAVICRTLCEPRILYHLPPGAFVPPPKVQSSVIRLRPLPERPDSVHLKLLQQVTQAAFGQRRKMLRTSLKAMHHDVAVLSEAAGIDPSRRAETLDIAEFGRLAEALRRLRQSDSGTA